MPSKRRNVKQPPAAAAVTQAAHAALAAAATADSAVKTAAAAASPTASAVSDAAAAVQSAIAAYQTVAAALAALHDSLAVSAVPTPLAAAPQPSAAVVFVALPLRELPPGHSWWDWMPSTVRRRLLVLAGIDPDASRWDTLPYELQLMILKAAGPLTLFVNDLLGDKSSLTKATVEALWTDAIAQDWQGDLDLLPDVNLFAGEVDNFESDPSVSMRSLPVSRSMYNRLCIRFPDQASADDDNDNLAVRRNHYETDIFRPPDLFKRARLRHTPMRNCWFDLIDFSYPIALGWLAIKFGHAGLLKHLVAHHGINLKKFKIYDGFIAMDLAAWFGHLDILKMLHDAGNRRCSYHAMDVAATQGFLHVVQWLHANRTEGCTTGAMDNAAMSGSLDVIKWLNANRTKGCTTDAMNYAAENGHLHVVQWLHSNRTEGCTAKAMNYAATYGHLDIVQWLHANRTEGCTTKAMDGAAGEGHLDIVQWLHANRAEGCTTKAMDRAAGNGLLHVVEWLHANRTEGCSANAIDDAVGNGHLHVVRFLVASGCPFTLKALRRAQNDAVVNLLLDSLPLARVLKLLRKARRKGGCPILAERLKHVVSKKKESAAA